nr:hypothetical protein CFP56_64869 [Quercus suber]
MSYWLRKGDTGANVGVQLFSPSRPAVLSGGLPTTARPTAKSTYSRYCAACTPRPAIQQEPVSAFNLLLAALTCPTIFLKMSKLFKRLISYVGSNNLKDLPAEWQSPVDMALKAIESQVSFAFTYCDGLANGLWEAAALRVVEISTAVLLSGIMFYKPVQVGSAP